MSTYVKYARFFLYFGMVFSGGQKFIRRTFGFGASKGTFSTLRCMSGPQPSSVAAL